MLRALRAERSGVLVALIALHLVVQPVFARPGDVFSVGPPVTGPTVQRNTEIPDNEFGVSTSTGAAQFTVPIVVPPGRNGMQPSLALTYSSQNPLRGGIAAGWSLHIPAIRVDTSEGRLAATHYMSTLAGNQRLIRVREPASPGAETYRAEHDSTYTRYERMRVTGTPGYWKALTPEGITYVFGNDSEARDDRGQPNTSFGPEARWFLTRMEDRFGNAVVYEYEKVIGAAWNGRVSNLEVDIALTSIEYTSNDNAGLGPFARINFGYAPLDLCPESNVPIGAQFDYRTGVRIYEGARRLIRIRTEARQAAGPWALRRQLDLYYDGEAMRCDQPHAPLRLLTSVQETGFDLDGQRVVLPPAMFEYGPLVHAFDDTGTMPGDAGHGRRRLSEPPAGIWPTVEKMWHDLDGDGRSDVLYSEGRNGDTDLCEFTWQRNLGVDGYSTPLSDPIALPTLPWAPNWQDQGCSLAAQFTHRPDDNGIHSPGVYASYRFMDFDGNGLSDLVLALDHDSGYDPKQDEALHDPWLYGTEPSCDADCVPPCFAIVGFDEEGEPFQEPYPASCRTSASGFVDGCGSNAAEPLEEVIAKGPIEPGGCSDWGGDVGCSGPNPLVCKDTCKSASCNPGDLQPCPCSSDQCEEDIPSFKEGRVGSEPDWGDAPTTPTDPSSVSGDSGTPRRSGSDSRCGRYLWRVYENRADGTFATPPRVRLSPVPLESEYTTSSVGTLPSSSFHGFHDMDGDGCMDAVWRPPSWDVTLPDHPLGPHQGAFQVFRGTCDGSFEEPPHIWPVPAWPGPARISLRTSGYIEPRIETNEERHRFAETVDTLQDVNGDGLPDLLTARTTESPRGGPLRVYYNTGTGFENAAGNGAQGTVLTNLTALDRQVTVVFSLDSQEWMTEGYARNSQAVVDLDEDGLFDIVAIAEPAAGQTHPWQDLQRERVEATHVNTGDRLLRNETNTAQVNPWAPALARITTSDVDKWHVMTDFRDFDGDGVADLYNNDVHGSLCPSFQGYTPTGALDGTSWEGCARSGSYAKDSFVDMRLLRKATTPRGAEISFEYAAGNDEAFVDTDPANGKRNPAPLRVVSAMTVAAGSGTPPATTRYRYVHPVFNRDNHGKWGFRGFEEVISQGPETALGSDGQIRISLTVERYRYDVDRSGRLTDRLVFERVGGAAPSEPPDVSPTDQVRSIESTVWRKFTLFDFDDIDDPELAGRVTTFHAMESKTWTCDSRTNVASTAEEKEAACRERAPLSRKVYGWRALEESDSSQSAGGTIKLPRAPPTSPDPPSRPTAGGPSAAKPSDSEPTSCFPPKPPLLVSVPPVISLRDAPRLSSTQRPPPADAVCDPAPFMVASRGKLEPVMYVKCGERLTDSRGASAMGDRRTTFRYHLVYEAAEFQLHEVERFKRVAQDASTEVMIGHSETRFDPSWRIPEESDEWMDGSGAQIATTCRRFDLATTGNLLRVTKPEQVKKWRAADLEGQLDECPPLDASPSGSTVFVYDSNGLYPATQTNPVGHVTHLVHDTATGKIICTAGPEQEQDWPAEVTKYDGIGRVTARWRSVGTLPSDCQADRQIEERTYDDYARPTLATTHTWVEYDGSVIQQVDRFADGISRPVREVTATSYGPAEAAFAYDPAGNVIAASLPDPTVDSGAVVTFSFEHDALGRVIRSVPPEGAPTVLTYDGLVTKRVELPTDDSQPKPVAIERDPFGRIVSVTEQAPAGLAVTTYAYDGNDNTRFIRDADGIVTDLVHDWGGRRVEIRRAGRTWRYTYDLNGNMWGETVPHEGDGMPSDLPYMTTWAHDDIDRPTSRVPGNRDLEAPDVERYGVGMVEFVYDEPGHLYGNGRLTSITRSFADTSFEYTDEGWVAAEILDVNGVAPFGAASALTDARTIRTTYNALGAPKRIEHADGQTVTEYTYDERGQIRTVDAHSISDPTTIVQLASFTRSVAGVPRVRTTSSGYSHEWTYDQLGRVLDHQARAAAGATFAGEEIDYGSTGNVRSLLNHAASLRLNFTYDTQHQLLTASSEDGGAAYDAAFTYSPGGRVLTSRIQSANPDVRSRDVTHTYPEPGEGDPAAVSILSDADGTTEASYEHDLAGNVVDRMVDGQSWGLVYDGDDQLREVIRNDDTREVYYYHDGGSRMLAVTQSPDPTESKARLWFGATEIVYDGAGAQAESIVHVSAGQAIARIVDGNVRDAELTFSGVLQSLLAVANSSSGLLGQFAYGPYGEVVWQEPADVSRYSRLFNGKERDSTTGLSYYGFRYYDRVALSWTQSDPFYQVAPEMAHSAPRLAALYSFSLNNPLRYVDPDGRDPKGGKPGEGKPEEGEQEKDEAERPEDSHIDEFVDNAIDELVQQALEKVADEILEARGVAGGLVGVFVFYGEAVYQIGNANYEKFNEANRSNALAGFATGFTTQLFFIPPGEAKGTFTQAASLDRLDTVATRSFNQKLRAGIDFGSRLSAEQRDALRGVLQQRVDTKLKAEGRSLAGASERTIVETFSREFVIFIQGRPWGP